MKKISLLIGFLLFSLVSMAQYSGSGTVTLSGIPTGATGIQWYKDAAMISGATNATYTATTAGQYYAAYTDASTTCTDDRTVLFILLNSGGNVALTGSTNNSSGSAYQWYNAGSAVASATTANYTATTGGLYSLKYNNGTCEIETQKYYVFVLAAAPITTSNPPALTAIAGSTQSGNASTELAATGGTAPFVYSNGAGDAACVAPSGATALSASSLTVTSSTGSYSYTAPSTAGTYYFCIKVCDSSLPTATCNVVTYTVTVSSDADVLPNFTFSNTAHTQGDQQTVIININNAGVSPTSGNIEVFVPSSSGFTYTFNATQTTATVTAAEVVNNPNWTMTTLATGMKFTSNTSIVGNSRSRIALTVNADTKGTDASLTANITPGSGGEAKGYNNMAVLAMSVQN